MAIRIIYFVSLFGMLLLSKAYGQKNPDESTVTRVIYVDQKSTASAQTGAMDKPFKTISAGLGDWDGTTPTKILVANGIYRETLRIDVSQSNNTVLVIEGKEAGKVIVSGSDEFAPSEWTSLGNGLYSHAWDKDFGNYDGNQGSENPKKLLGHRREMIFINGKPLTPVILEDYNYTPKPAGDYGGQGSWQYKGYLGTAVLKPGTFGVAEREEDKIYIKLADSINFNSAKIEVAVREKTLTADWKKNNLVLRNLVFQHAATKFEDGGSVEFGDRWTGFQLSNHVKNVLLENIDINYNNDHGLWMMGTINMNLKNVKSNFNGGNGIGCAYIQKGRWEDTETSYNNWRSEGLGGGYGWASAGMKVNWCSKDMTFIRHTAIGNPSIGFWFDGNNYRNTMEGLIIKNNKYGVNFEISEGPLTITNSVITDNVIEGIAIVESGNVFIKNCTVANNIGTQIEFGGKNSGRDRTVPEEYRGPEYAEPQKIGKVSIVSNKIYTDKGKNSYLLAPEYLLWSTEEPTFGNFLKTQLWADSNLYYNPDITNVFGISIDNTAKDGFRVGLSGWRTALNENSTFGRNRETNSRWAKELMTSAIRTENLSINKNLNLYPNPAQQEINILLTDEEDNGIYDVSVLDLSGRAVYGEDKLSAVSNQSFSLDIKGLSPGFYMVRLEEKSGAKILLRPFTIAR